MLIGLNVKVPVITIIVIAETATYLSFEELNYAVLETSSNEVRLKVIRTGDLNKSTSVREYYFFMDLPAAKTYDSNCL